MVVAVTSAEKTVRIEPAGFADIHSGRPMAHDTVFWIASMSKTITALALMMQVDAARVDLDRPVRDYLPEFTPKILRYSADRSRVLHVEPERPITVRMVLSHTAGLPYMSTLEHPTSDAAPIATQVQGYALTPLIREPGGDYAYADAGLNVAARIIEVCEGEPFEEVLQRRLFDPLGMVDTTFWPNEQQLARLATSYSSGPDGFVPAAIGELTEPYSDRSRHPAAGGGLFSTAPDVAALCRLFLGRGETAGTRFVSAAAITAMTRNQLDADRQPGAAAMLSEGEFLGYGLGLLLHVDGGFGHGGAHGTRMRIDPRSGLATVWMMQHTGMPVPPYSWEAADAFEATVLRNPAPPERRSRE